MTSPFPTPWFDVIYQAQPDCTAIEVRVGQFSRTYPVLHGGHRMVCIELPETGMLDWEITGNGDFEVVSMGCRRTREEVQPLLHNQDALWQAKNKMGFLPVSVQWFVTWKCNYQCSYCWQETVSDAYRKERPSDAPWEDWVTAIKRLSPQHLYLSGGEPTLHKNITDLVRRLGNQTPVYLTTNLGKSFNLDKWRADVPKESVDNITCSFHPTQVSWDEFSPKWKQLIGWYGPDKVGLEIVDSPANQEFVPKVKALAAEYAPRICNIDPYHHQPQIRLHQPSDSPCSEKPDYRRAQSPETSDDPRTAPKYCAAGMRRINIDPRGDAYTCMSAIDRSKMFGQHSLGHYSPIGNVLDPDFQLNENPTLCWEAFRCSGCDVSQVASTWVDHGSDLKLPLPE